MDKEEHSKRKSKFSEIRFEAIAETATDSILISDINSIIVFANKAAYKVFGYKESELIGMSLEKLMPEKYREAHRKGIQRFLDTAIPKLIGHTVEIEGLRKDKSVFPLELSLSSWKEENDIFFSGIIRDITSRKQFIKEKEEANKKLYDQQKELEAANEELQTFQEELVATNKELLNKEQLLTKLNHELEQKVLFRTEQIERQREWLHNLFMQVPALIGVLKGREGRISLFNKTFSQLFSSRSLFGKTMREAWPELEGQGYFKLIEQVYDTAEPVVRKEYPAMIDLHNNGKLQEAFFNFVYAPYYDTNGNVEGVIVYGENVTDQVHAKREIEESAARFHLMADAMPQKVWTAKPDGNVDYLNKQWLDYTDLSFEEMKDWGWQKIVHPNDWEENERVWLHSIKTGTDFQLEHRFKRKDGQYRWHLSRGLAQRNENGDIRMWIGTNTDIHDHKLAQEKLLSIEKKLRQSNEELNKINQDLDNFIYTASHDLKSPIANLEGLVTLVKQHLENKIAEKDEILLQMIEKSVLRLKNTITDLTEITKVQKGIDEEEEQISFKVVLDDVKEDLAEKIKEAKAIIREKLEEPQIHYSKKSLRSILLNLLSNAIKYRSPDRPLQIEVTTYRKEDYIVLSVKDNGMGLSEQQQSKLFTMFKRFHSHVEGTGIGLYIIKRIVENNGGKIEVESELHKGSQFNIFF